MTGSQPGVRAGRREWAGLAVLALPSMLAMIDISVLFLALPHLTEDLGATATQQLWVSDIYGFLIAGFLVTMGTLGDRIGRRRVLLTGSAAFGVLSLVAAFSVNTEMLIAARALMGIAGATIFPTTLAMIMTMFRDPKERGTAVAVWATSLTAGVALGPVVGGVLLNWFWWGSVFLIALPVMLLLLATGPSLLPEFKNPEAGRLDLTSVALSLAAILPFVYGLKEVARAGWEAVPVLAVLVGVGMAVVFVLRQRRMASPLLDLRLFAIRALSGALVLALLVAAIQGGTGFFIAQHLQLVEGRTPLNAGLWLLIPTFTLIIGIFMGQGMAQQIRPAFILTAGTLVSAAGMIILTQITASTGLAVVLLGIAIVYLGVGPVGPIASQLIVPAAPPEKAGSASSLQTTSSELGIALGVAMLGSVGTAVYRSDVTVPAEIAGTPAGDTAGETIAGAFGVAQSQPPAVAGGLVESAREAFTAGLSAAAVVCAVAFVGLAVVAFMTLRHVNPFAAGGGPGLPSPPSPAGEQEEKEALAPADDPT